MADERRAAQRRGVGGRSVRVMCVGSADLIEIDGRQRTQVARARSSRQHNIACVRQQSQSVSAAAENDHVQRASN